MKKRNIIITIVCICVAMLTFCMRASIAVDDAGAVKYYIEGQKCVEEGNLDQAIENFKKVLYVQRNHSRSSWALAEIYELKKEFRKAEREYRFFLRIANDDKTLSKEKRRELTLIAENKLEEFKLMRKTDRARYKGRLNLIELNILLLAITVCVLFFLRAITFLHCFVRDQIRARRESKIWLDRYWESRKEKTVSRFSFGVSRAIVYAIVFVVLFYAGRLISIYGLRECFISLWHAFTSLF